MISASTLYKGAPGGRILKDDIRVDHYISLRQTHYHLLIDAPLYCRSALQAGTAVVSADWLLQRLDHRNLRVLDASWHMPAAKRDVAADFVKGRIRGARLFDVDGIADVSSGLPHMLPSARGFAAAADALGIDATDTVVLYDAHGIFSAPRAWFTFRAFGHRGPVAILEGGYPAWAAKGVGILYAIYFFFFPSW